MNNIEMTERLPCVRTPYGMKWGETTISRACEHKSHIFLMIETPRQRVIVRVTPSGLIRIDAVEANKGEMINVSV